MSGVAPPEQPGWYADAHGAWWWWDGAGWTPAPGGGSGPGSTGSPRQQERSHALLSWILYLVGGGWIAALVFYLTSEKKPFVRHHAAEALNLTLLLLPPQIVGIALLVPTYIDFVGEAVDDPSPRVSFSGPFFVGVALSVLTSIVHLALGVTAALKAHRGEWWRLPIGLHPVRGVLGRDEAPPYSVTEG